MCQSLVVIRVVQHTLGDQSKLDSVLRHSYKDHVSLSYHQVFQYITITITCHKPCYYVDVYSPLGHESIF